MPDDLEALAPRLRTVSWQRDGDVGVLRFDRPERRNAMTNTMARELHEVASAAAADADLAVLVLTGAGEHFCPGADLVHYSAGEEEDDLRPEHFDTPVLLREMPAVTIAAVNGACAGAGLGYALACDLRYASAGARLNTAFLDVGVAGDMGLPWTLTRLVGAGRARELSLLPRKLTAFEAEELGLVEGVFPAEELLDRVWERARRIADAAPLARRALKEHYLAAEQMGFGPFVRLEGARHREITASEDTREAFRAYVEKRPPRYQGR